MLVNKTSCRTEADIELIIDDEHISRWVIFTKWCEYHRRRKIYLFPLFLSSKSEPPPSPSTFVFLLCCPSPYSPNSHTLVQIQIQIQILIQIPPLPTPIPHFFLSKSPLLSNANPPILPEESRPEKKMLGFGHLPDDLQNLGFVPLPFVTLNHL